ncbi:MAG TPA: GTP cyclohydrolase II [Clostridiaceae bacterium]
MFNKIEDALKDIKAGKMVIAVDDDNLEGNGFLVMSSNFAEKEKINFMMKYGGGFITLVLEEDAMQKLDLPISAENKSGYIASLDFVENTTGISAQERALTIKKVIGESFDRHNFIFPGHVFLYKGAKGGVLKKASFIELALDLSELAEQTPSGILSQILTEDGSVAKLPDLISFGAEHNLKIISIEDLIAYRRERECYVTQEAEANLPTEFGHFKMVGFVNRLNGEHHIALVKGEISEEDEVLIRVHSECLTGDAFHSLKCDCGQQLTAALMAIEKEGKGILLYLRQEGRGIGLINKIKAYKLQEEGMDTEEANLALGFPSDMRDYGIGAQILSELNVKKVRLMTNNPKKIVGLRGHGIEIIARVPIIMDTNPYNERYFSTKKEKMGHLY